MGNNFICGKSEIGDKDKMTYKSERKSILLKKILKLTKKRRTQEDKDIKLFVKIIFIFLILFSSMEIYIFYFLRMKTLSIILLFSFLLIFFSCLWLFGIYAKKTSSARTKKLRKMEKDYIKQKNN